MFNSSFQDITDCIGAKRIPSESINSQAKVSHRQRLTRSSLGRKFSQDVTASIPSSHLCTILFELRGSDTSNVHPKLAPVPSPRTLLSCSQVRIVYDRFHVCNPSNPSLLVYLHLKPSQRFPVIRSSFPSTIAHAVRIVPSTERKRFRSPLSLCIVHRIAGFVIGGKAKGWRADLLYCGLVCKTWVQVLDLFFEVLGDGNVDGDRPEAARVARSLKAAPHRGRFIHTFDTWNYEVSSGEGWQNFIDILGHATSVRDILLLSVPKSMVASLEQTLLKLSEVRRLSLTTLEWDDECNAMDMPTIQKIISNLPRLSKFELCDWLSCSPTDDESTPLPCKLEYLYLKAGVITSFELARFVASPVPHLKELDLRNIEGLTTAEFTLILSSVANTLSKLCVYKSPMPLSSSDEELALDAVMPIMVALRTVKVDGEIAGALTLSRKTSSLGRGDTITIYDAHADTMQLTQLRKAVEVTGWDSISIVWHTAHPDGPLHDSILQAASERGIIMSLGKKRRVRCRLRTGRRQAAAARTV